MRGQRFADTLRQRIAALSNRCEADPAAVKRLNPLLVLW